jgi:hypothetical protein
VFASGSAANYNISYANGYLIVLPKPTGYAGNSAPEGGANPANLVLLIQINEDELKQAGGELGKQQTVLMSRGGGVVETVPSFEVKPIQGNLDVNNIRQLAQRNQRIVRENSATVIQDLRGQPIILWHPGLPEQMFKISLSEGRD